MLLSYTKFFFIILCSLFLYKKILNIPADKKSYCKDAIIAFFIALLVCPVKIYLNSFMFPILILALTVFITYQTTYSFKIAFITATLSFSFAYIADTFATILTIPVKVLLVVLSFNGLFADFLTYVVSGCIEQGLARIPFLTNRLKKGMPFLFNEKITSIGFVVDIIFLLTLTAYRLHSLTDNQIIVYALVISIFTILLFLWWLKRIKLNYMEKLKIREMDKLKQEIQLLQDKMEELSHNNDDLNELIAKDEKLLNVMKHVVKSFSEMDVFPDENTRSQAEDLFNSLNAVSGESSQLPT